VHLLAQPRGSLGFPDDPSAQRRRGIAPKNIATFNTHTQALEPMAGALWTSYDASFPAIWAEAMKRRSRAGAEPAKARRRKSVTLKRRNGPKTVRRRISSAASLRKQVALLTRERDEALERQTATGEILSSISGSIADTKPVFDAIVRNLLRLFGTRFATIQLLQDGIIHLAAVAGEPGFERLIEHFPRPLDDKSFSGRAMLLKEPFQFAPIVDNPAVSSFGQQTARDFGYNSVIFTPMIRGDKVIGAIGTAHREPKPFSDKQVGLLRAFADQAVIAIENVRLFEAEQQRTRELAESLEQQTATAEILQVINSSPVDLAPVFDAMLEKALQLCEAAFGVLWTYDGARVHAAALRGVPLAFAEFLRRAPHPVGPDNAHGRLLRGEFVVHITDVTEDQAYRSGDPIRRTLVELGGGRTLLAVPLRKDGTFLGDFVIYRQEVRPFTEKQIELLQNFAAQAVIAIENARLLNELRQRTIDLTESLKQQTATSEVLQVISGSPGDLEPVFAAMLEKAVLICDAKFGNIYRWDGNALHVSATYNSPPAYAEVRRHSTFRADQNRPLGRMILTKTVVHIADLAADPGYIARIPQTVAAVELGGVRTFLAVPMLNEGELIGAFGLSRQEVRPFADKQIALVENFAAQAVIAIENTRLLNELRESLQQQTATADVLKVISRSTFDLQTVLDTLVQSAARLCAADKGTILLQDGDVYRIRAHYGLPREAVQYALLQPLRPDGSSVTGRVALEGKAIHILDVLADPEYRATDYQKAFGFRTLLGVPLMRDGTTIGVFALNRDEVSPFTDKQIELVSTFADQAVIAIENARLLNELRESLQQQSATADVLKVISRSAFDLQSVLDTLVESAARLCDADSAAIHRPAGNSYPYVASYGYTREYHEYMRGRPIIPGRGTVLGRAVTECKPIQVNDVEADPEYTLRQGQRLGGFRTVLGIPLLREGVPIGVIVLTRNTVRPFTDKQIELATTFADQAAIAIENVRLFEAEQQRTQELARSIEDLRTTQDRLIQTEKLASLGQLTAGIAHEIKNPLNFVNNFSAVSVELIDELREALGGAHLDSKLRAEVAGIADMLQGNLDKVVQHGKRADAIVKNMLLHSRQGSGEHRPVDINALVEESLNLAYHGARAEKQGFNITLERSFDPAAGEADLFPQEITRALLNLISNGFYAATKRKGDEQNGGYEPTLKAATKNLGERVEIKIRDNGTGIPPEVKEKLFNPFFTTKPAGEGTGLGLSISHDIIVKQHGGSIEVDTQPGEFTEFRIVLPRAGASLIKSGERA
jgi:two-component system NtrC family sensor kinase